MLGGSRDILVRYNGCLVVRVDLHIGRFLEILMVVSSGAGCWVDDIESFIG